MSSIPKESGFKEAIKQTEVALLQNALEQTRFNQRKSAKLLQLTYDQFRGLMRKHKDVFLN